MHAKVEPNHQVLLLQTLAIEKVIKVNRRVRSILAIVSMCAPWLCILLSCDTQVMVSPVGAVLDRGRVFDREVRTATSG